MHEKTKTHLDLFSGIGGFALAARWAGYQTIAFCEQDRFCQRVLERHWRGVPCIEDVHDLDGKDYEGVTLLTGGFPCQPYSQAGKRRGEDDDRALGGEMVRVISEARPTWALGENVAGFETLGLGGMLSDLEGLGYAVQTFRIPAVAVDARHQRDRIWIVAHANNTGNRTSANGANEDRSKENQGRQIQPQPKPSGSSEDVAHSNSLDVQGRGADGDKEGRQGSHQGSSGLCGGGAKWDAEPDVGRVAHGIPNRVDRLKGLGNAIVPQVAYEIIKAMEPI